MILLSGTYAARQCGIYVFPNDDDTRLNLRGGDSTTSVLLNEALLIRAQQALTAARGLRLTRDPEVIIFPGDLNQLVQLLTNLFLRQEKTRHTMTNKLCDMVAETSVRFYGSLRRGEVPEAAATAVTQSFVQGFFHTLGLAYLKGGSNDSPHV